jgi:hypothetical protein
MHKEFLDTALPRVGGPRTKIGIHVRRVDPRRQTQRATPTRLVPPPAYPRWQLRILPALQLFHQQPLLYGNAPRLLQ